MIESVLSYHHVFSLEENEKGVLSGVEYVIGTSLSSSHLTMYVFPLPRIDDLLEQLSGKYLFSTLDARRGYWQIPVSDDSRPKTAFAMHKGLYEFWVMPFGLCNAPATFQQLMQRILSGMNSFCNVYIDDILIFSRNPEEHQEHLEQVFQHLEQYGLKLHPDKCQLAHAEVEYLGHIVSGEGICPRY